MIIKPVLTPSFNYMKGVALITVMLIVALAAILATQMTARLQLQMQRTANISFNQQAYWYAMSAEAFVKRVLISSFEKDEDVTNLEQMWAQGQMSYPVDYGDITGEIKDLQSCLNLNALKNDTPQGKNKTLAQQAFEELVISLNIEGVSEFEAEYLTDSLIDWLDSDSGIISAGGAEDNDYAAREFAYLAANNYLGHYSELRTIEHFTVPIIYALKEHVCVIPNNNVHAININTLDSDKPEFLKALLDISLSEAKELLSAREMAGFEDTNEFFTLPEFTKLTVSDERKKQFVVDSEYFTLNSTSSFNNSYFSLQSIFKVDDNNKIRVINRTIGRE